VSVLFLASGSVALVARLAGEGNPLGHMMTPRNTNLAAAVRTGLPFALDNGAFAGFDAARFRRSLAAVRGLPRCLFVVCPDVVGDARATLAAFWRWGPEVRDALQPVALAAQDGLEGLDVPWNWFNALFLGGSTAWKLSRAAADLAGEAKRRGLHAHMGRVNTLRRMTYARRLGCDSVDGSGLSKRPDKFARAYCRWLREAHRPTLWEAPAGAK
jgi:hypothetical protein